MEKSEIDSKFFIKLLKRNNLTIGILCEELGIHRQAVWKWKKFNKFPKYIDHYFHNYELQREVDSISETLNYTNKRLEYYKQNYDFSKNSI